MHVVFVGIVIGEGRWGEVGGGGLRGGGRDGRDMAEV